MPVMRGTFFSLDKNSLQGEGQVLFRYLPVSLSSGDKVYHPVYVTIKPYSVDFFYHGEDKKSPALVNTCIMSLPLSMNLAVKDNLSFALRNLYNDYYEINPKYYNESDQRITYWNLEVFNPRKYDKEKLFFRKLLLDFIFDLEHSGVFEASPHYEVAEVHLKENFYFSAIASKAAYYYLRKQYQDCSQEDEPKKLYAIQLKDAEKQWLNTIRDLRAGELFGGDHKWFEPVEKEYTQVMFKSSQNKWDRAMWREYLEGKNKKSANDLEEENIRILSQTARWFSRRYAIGNGVKALFQHKKKWQKEMPVGIFIIFLVFLSLIFFNRPEIESWGAAISVYLLLSILLLPLLLLFVLGKGSITLTAFGILLPRLIMATASTWLVFISTEELWKVSFDTRFHLVDLSPALLLLLPVTIFMALEIHNIDAEIKGRDIAKRICSVLLIGFIYSLIIGLFFIHLNGPKMLIRSSYLPEAVQEVARSDVFKTPQAWKKDISKSGKFDISRKISDSRIFNELKEVKYKFLYSGNELHLKYDVPVFNGYKVHFFPGMLVYRAVFALFIGIFVQLIFEDKPITEPL